MIKISLSNQKKFSGLEIGVSFIKFVQAERNKSSKKITKLIIKKLPSASQQDSLAALTDINRQIKGQFGRLTFSIPADKTTVRFLRFPSVQDQEIDGMVKLQAVKELPFGKDEIISDYLITEKTNDGFSKVALVIVHKDVIEEYLKLLQKANIYPQRINFSSEGILDWHNVAFDQKTQECSVLLDLDADSATVAVFYNFTLDFTRNLNFGMAQLKGEPGLLQRLINEIRLTVDGYARVEKDRRLAKILLSQSANNIPGLKETLEKAFGLPIEVFRPFKNLDCLPEVYAAPDQDAVSLFSVLGAVLEAQGKKINLMPQALKDKAQLIFKKEKLIKIAALSAIAIILSLLSAAKGIYDKRAYIRQLNQEISYIAPLAQDVENMIKRIDLVKARKNMRLSSIGVLRELHLLTPASIFLSAVNYDEESGFVVIQGVSEAMPDIFGLVESLGKSALLKEVKLKYVSEKKLRSGNVTEFKIEANLESGQ